MHKKVPLIFSCDRCTMGLTDTAWTRTMVDFFRCELLYCPFYHVIIKTTMHFCFVYFHRSGIASLGLSKTSGLMNRQCKTNLTLIDQVYFHFFFLQNASIYIFSDALASLALMIICN